MLNLPAAHATQPEVPRKKPGLHESVGCAVGSAVGDAVGLAVGNVVGNGVGAAVGDVVGTELHALDEVYDAVHFPFGQAWHML